MGKKTDGEAPDLARITKSGTKFWICMQNNWKTQARNIKSANSKHFDSVEVIILQQIQMQEQTY